jgi:cell division septation protein DedD
MSDEGFHEIQLNGKQLVFLFMAATVVSVVIFLCGVMVGRGVPDRSALAANESAGATPEPAPDNDYFDDLVNGQKDTRVGTAKGRASVAPPKQREPAPAAKPPVSAAAKPAAAPAAVVERTSSSSGYAVQLAAVRERSEADAIARRLVSKGYQAYVLVPQPGKPPVYRVQVGRFKNRSEADKIASRLRKNEQFKPWVTR